MKQFFKKIFITTLSFVLAFIFLISCLSGLLMLKFQSTLPKLHEKSILHIPLRGTIVEYQAQTPVQALTSGKKEWIDLMVLRKCIQAAQKDKHIQGIYLEADGLVGGWASLEEIRADLQAFKETGKFIIAYGESYNNKTYYLASLADEIVLHPCGTFLFNGLNLTVSFYKQLLDKLEVNPEVFKVGRYKSAIEPITSIGMSEASKQQNTILLNTIYDHMLHKIAAARSLSVDRLKDIANDTSMLYSHPQGMHEASLVTQIGHQADVETLINNKLGVASDAVIHYVNFNKYQGEGYNIQSQNSKSKIAVLVANGDIVNESESSNHINSKKFVQDLKDLRNDPTVKAIVLRINSPGGSALASEIMWKELMFTKTVKPVVASMADVAASGGYYIATACQHIVAHPTTITGSIGVYYCYFNVNGLLKNKLGITMDGIKTSPSADLGRYPRALTIQEKVALQKSVERTYDTFLERVILGRQIDGAHAARLAEGRIWPGSLAKEHGLVDELGNLETAIDKAVELAAIKEPYTILYSPEPNKSMKWLKACLVAWQESKNNQFIHLVQRLMNFSLDAPCVDLATIQEMKSMEGMQARSPYKLEID